jgi:aryl-phospho-beta-D-glucosidase BglC (GH1 family)
MLFLRSKEYDMRKFTGFNKGINLGGWLSQNNLTDEHLDTFITEDDIKRIGTMGVDHIRIPMDYSIFEEEDGAHKEHGYTCVDNCIKWCEENNLNVILDLHRAAGYIFDDFENSRGFFHDEKLQQRFINLWDKLSKRYGNKPDSIAFELLNEVVEPEVAEDWNALAERTIKKIRENAPDTWILVGGTRNNSITSVKELRAPYDDKIVFNFHCYDPIIFTHQAAYWVPGMTPDFRIEYPKSMLEYEKIASEVIHDFPAVITGFDDEMCSKDFFVKYFKEAVEISNKYNVPLYCGEYGVIDQAEPAYAVKWFEDIHAAFEELGIGRAMWSYKEMDFGLIDKHYEGVYEEIVKNL